MLSYTLSHSHVLQNIVPPHRQEFLDLAKALNPKIVTSKSAKSTINIFDIKELLQKEPNRARNYKFYDLVSGNYTFKYSDLEYLFDDEVYKICDTLGLKVDRGNTGTLPKTNLGKKKVAKDTTENIEKAIVEKIDPRSLLTPEHFTRTSNRRASSEYLNQLPGVNSVVYTDIVGRQHSVIECRHPRILYKKDLNDITKFVERITTTYFSQTIRRQHNAFVDPAVQIARYNKIVKDNKLRDHLIFENVWVEGVHFNVDEKDAICKQTWVSNQVNDEEVAKVFEYKEGIYFVNCVDAANIINSHLANRPVKVETFTKNLIHSLLGMANLNTREKEDELQELFSKTIKLQKEIGDIRMVQNAISHSGKAKMLKSIQDIKNIPNVESLETTYAGMRIITNDLYIDYREQERYCGKFEILVSIIGKYNVTFRNIAAPNKVSQQPHSGKDGICVGTYKGAIGSCLEHSDYYTFILTIIAMIKNVSLMDSVAVARMKHFPVKKPPQAELYEFPNYISVTNLVDRNRVIRNQVRKHNDDYDDDGYDD